MTDEKFSKELTIERIVLKDLSFETPMGQDAFAGEWKVEFDMDLQIRSNKLADHLWEVILMTTVTAKVPAGIAFLIEAQEAGVFKVPELDAERRRRVLAVEAPLLIYPYLRESLDNVVTRGGFPPVKLQIFDFASRYEEARQSPDSKPPKDDGT